MSGGVKVTRVVWNPQKAERRVSELTKLANERAAERVRLEADKRVPYATGELAASAHVETSEHVVAVEYTARHGRYVHAHPEWNFQGGRSGRWLEEAIEASADPVGEVYADTLRSGWTG